MNYTRTRQTVFIILLCTAQAWAAPEDRVYRWVDEDGRVHYSDKTRIPAEAEVEAIAKPESGGGFHEPEIEHLQPLPFSADLKNRDLVVIPPTVFDDIRPEYSFEIGSYLFSQHCGGATAMRWPDALEKHTNFFPKPWEMQRAVQKALESVRYRVRTSTTENLVRTTQYLKSPLVLRGNISEIFLDACAPGVSSGLSGIGKKRLQSGDFTSVVVSVKLDWILEDVSGNGERHRFSSWGFADNRKEVMNTYPVVKNNFLQAMAMAVDNLAAMQNFRTALTPEPTSEPATPVFNEPMYPERPPRPVGMFGGVFDAQSSILVWVILVILALGILDRIIRRL